MKKILLLLILCMGMAELSVAQSKSGYRIEGSRKKGGGSSNDWMRNVFFQPNFYFSFGSGDVAPGLTYNQWSIYLAPNVGYNLLEGLAVGVGPSYIYASTKFSDGDKFSSNAIGGNAFARYMVKDPFFIMTQYEILSAKDSGFPERYTLSAFYAGAGVLQSLGGNSFLMFAVLYDLTYDEATNYGSPISFNFGIVVNPSF